jgi:hypothetical protein
LTQNQIPEKEKQAVNQQQPIDQQNGKADPLVISRIEEGFRVYSPADPTKTYIVGGGPDDSTCTCPDFAPRWRCKHIQAVLDQLGITPSRESDDPDERQAIQHEELPEAPQKNGGAQMLLKRSVSPDGRIDSLSVEFSCPVDRISANEIVTRAVRTLQLQSEIAKSFLADRSANNGQQAVGSSHGNGAASAQMVSIGGINTKWGRRLFINIQVNGQTLKFFGSRKQLAETITAIGFANLAERLDEGKQLNVPCRVVTKPSEDGRYINVEQVLPAEARPQRRGW